MSTSQKRPRFRAKNQSLHNENGSQLITPPPTPTAKTVNRQPPVQLRMERRKRKQQRRTLAKKGRKQQHRNFDAKTQFERRASDEFTIVQKSCSPGNRNTQEGQLAKRGPGCSGISARNSHFASEHQIELLKSESQTDRASQLKNCRYEARPHTPISSTRQRTNKGIKTGRRKRKVRGGNPHCSSTGRHRSQADTCISTSSPIARAIALPSRCPLPVADSDSEEEHEQAFDRLLNRRTAAHVVSTTYARHTRSDLQPCSYDHDHASLCEDRFAFPDFTPAFHRSASITYRTLEFLHGLYAEQMHLFAQSREIEDEINDTHRQGAEHEALDDSRVQALQNVLDLTSTLCHDLFLAEYALRDVLDVYAGDGNFEMENVLVNAMQEVGTLVEGFDERVAKVMGS